MDDSNCKLHRPWVAPLTLFLLAPAIGELVSSSSPPAEYFNPVGFLLMNILYGGGALLCRELTVRWRKSWLTLLALGAAYGIVEEGLMVKSFFNPNWQDIGPGGPYARWGGVNWMWSFSLTAYHAVFSITIPVLLTHLLFPADSGRSWLNRKWIRIISVLFALDILVGFLFFGDNGADKTPFRPPVVPYLLAIASIAVIVLVAKRLPSTVASASPGTTPVRPRMIRLFLTGLLGTLGMFVVGGLMSAWHVPGLLGVLVLLAYLAFLFTLVLRRVRRDPNWGERQQWTLAVGALSLFIAVDPLREFVLPHADNTTGMAAVGLAAVLFLTWIRWRIGGRVPAQPPSLTPSQPDPAPTTADL